MSVSPSARLSGLGETRFSPFFCADSPMYEHLSYKYFVGQSIGQATNGKKIFSRLLLMIKLWFFCEDSSVWCASILWVICPSVCLSGYKSQKCKNTKTWFSRLIFKIELWFFFVKICMVDTHLFYCLSVCLSGYERHKCKNIL